MDALEKEIQAIIGSYEETDEVSADETDESIEEAYKTKDQVKAEVDELLSTMKRSDLVDAKTKLTPQEDEITEEPDDDTVGGEDEKDEADVEPEGDFEDLATALASLEEDEKGIMAAIDDVMDDDYKEPTDEDDDEWTEQDDEIVDEVTKIVEKVVKKKKRKGAEGNKKRKAARLYYKKNKKRIQKLAKMAAKKRKGKKKATVKMSHFDPTLNKEEVDIHVEALLEGEGLSDDFKEKASVIFEGAVNSKVDATIENLKEQFDTQLEQATEQVHDELATKVDTYLNYVVEQWLEDNKLAVEKGLRTELTEDFIGGMKTLFEQHYIDVPETKIDIFDDLSERVEELEDKLNAEIDKNIQLEEKLSQSEKEGIIEESAQDLSEIQTEKLKELAGVVDFTTSQEFSDKVQMIKENYFPTTSEPKTKPVDAPEYVGKGGSMERYTQMLSRSIK